MWQRFTERARRVILLAQEEAGKLNSAHVGTEHLLLGLARENEGVAAQVLVKTGISLSKVRAEVESESVISRAPTDGEPKLTPKAKRVLELGADEARRMRHNYIGTEHLLLALLREKDGLAATVLRRLGLNLEKTRAQVLEYLGPDAPGSESEVAEVAEGKTEQPQLYGWQRFSPRGRRVVLLAQEEAINTQSGHVGSEQLLVGLLRDEGGIAAHALEGMGVTLTKVRRIIAESAAAQTPFIAGDGDKDDPKLSPRARRILELAADEARRYRLDNIGTEHILSAIFRQTDCQAATILRSFRIDLEEARAAVLDYAGPREAPPDPLRQARKSADERTPRVKKDDADDKPALWNRLDTQAQTALTYAQQEATLRRHASVGGEHILLGLVSMPRSTAAGMLRERGVTLASLRAAIRAFAPDGKDDGAAVARLDPNVAALLERAAAEAKSLGRYAIGAEHLLLALLSDKAGIAAQLVHHLMSEASDIEARLNARLAPATQTVDLPAERLRCSDRTVEVLEIAAAQARRLAQSEITPEILFAALLRVSDETLEAILKRAKKDIEASGDDAE